MSFGAIAAVSLDGVRQAVRRCDLFAPPEECLVTSGSVIGVGSHVIAPQDGDRDPEEDQCPERTDDIGWHVSWTRGTGAARSAQTLVDYAYHGDGSTLVAVLRPTAQGR